MTIQAELFHSYQDRLTGLVAKLCERANGLKTSHDQLLFAAVAHCIQHLLVI
jgi:hypothetical protein